MTCVSGTSDTPLLSCESAASHNNAFLPPLEPRQGCEYYSIWVITNNNAEDAEKSQKFVIWGLARIFTDLLQFIRK